MSKTDPTKSRGFSSLACDNIIVWDNLCCVLCFVVLIASSVFYNSYIMALRLIYVVQRLNNNSYTESNSQFTSNVQPNLHNLRLQIGCYVELLIHILKEYSIIPSQMCCTFV
jgi:hypothetical protein